MPEIFWRKLGTVSPHVEAKMRRTKLCQKGFWIKLGSFLSCLFIIAPKFFWRKLGSIFPHFEANYPKRFLGKIGQHFVLLLIHKMWQIKLPQRFLGENWAAFSLMLKQIIPRRSWAKLGSILSCFYRKLSQIELPQRCFWENWAAFSLMKPKCGEPNYPKRFLEKVGQHFVLFLIHKMSHSSPKILPQKFFP